MALTGIQIFKFLPKTNCKACGAATCLAFAMNLAAGKTELEQCPHLSPAAQAELAAASAPPISRVVVGAGEHSHILGDESVLFRHEKTFNHPPLLAALLEDHDQQLTAKLEQWSKLQWPRVGLTLRPEMVFLRAASQNAAIFLQAAKLAQKYFTLALAAPPEILEQTLPELASARPLLYAAEANNCDPMAQLAKSHDCPLVASAPDLSALSQLSARIKQQGVKSLLLHSQSNALADVLADNVTIRRSALLDKNSALGHPVINFAKSGSMAGQVMAASLLISKYAGIVVLDDFQSASLLPLLLLRLNLYTDPQRPMTLAQGIYPVANAEPDSPLLITTNFSLTYFMVNGEIENSRVAAWLLIMDTEGLSVLTAWAAGKFVGDTIAEFIHKSGIREKINHQNLIIPGYVSNIQHELRAALPGWNIVVGPREVSGLPKFLKNLNQF